MKKYISIREKFTIYFIFIGIVAIIVIGVLAYNSTKEALLNRTFEQLISVRIEKKNRIENFIKDRTRDINQVASTADIQKIITAINNSRCDDKNLELRLNNLYFKFLNKYLSSYEYFDRMYLTNRKGEVFTADIQNKKTRINCNIESFSVFKTNWDKVISEKRAIIHDLYLDPETHKISFSISYPVINSEDSITNIITLQMPVNCINQIMYDNNPHNGLGKSGESYLVGNDYLMRSTSRFKDNSVFNTQVKTEGVLAAFNGKTSTEIIQDYRDIKVLSSYSKINIPDLQWVILAEIDFEEAMVPVINIRNKILFLSVMISLFIFGITYVLSTQITKPIILLKDAAEIIAIGDKIEKLKIRSNDELGQHTESFNIMAEEIQEQKKDLRLSKIRSLTSMIDGQENERQRLSRELHDSLGQLLIALKLKYENTIDDKEKTVGEEEVSKMIDQTIEETRKISNNLMSAVLSEFGLETALKNLCRDISDNTTLKVATNINNIPDVLSDEFKTYIYRISQESLNNIVKHANAKNVELSFVYRQDPVQTEYGIFELIIKDDGKGFNVLNAKKCLNTNGLRNMEERISLLKGTLNIITKEGQGTEVHVKIPYYKKYENNQNHIS